MIPWAPMRSMRRPRRAKGMLRARHAQTERIKYQYDSARQSVYIDVFMVVKPNTKENMDLHK